MEPLDRRLLDLLDGAPAGELESETMECKFWHPDPGRWKGQAREIRETVVCLANRRGGTILLGIADGKRTRAEAIVGVGDLDAERLRREVYRGTSPPILVEALSDLLRGRVATDLELHVDEEAARLRVQTVLAERGALTSAEIRTMTGLSRPEVVRLMSRLRDEGLARVEGRGRAARWVRGPRLPRPRRKK